MPGRAKILRQRFSYETRPAKDDNSQRSPREKTLSSTSAL